MQLKGVLFDLDNTLYSYEPCNQAGQQAVLNWLSKQLGLPVRKLQQHYDQARQQIHEQLVGQAASHSRLLYLLFKRKPM